MKLTKITPRWLRNSLLFPLWFLNGWLLVRFVDYLQPMFSIFIVSVVLALVLDFPVKFLQQRGLKRSMSLAIVLCLGLVLLILAAVLLVPTLLAQLQQFIELLPNWISSAAGLLNRFEALPFVQNNDTLRNLESQLAEQLTTVLQGLAGGILGLLLGSFSGGLTLFFIIVLTIFMLASGAQAWHGVLRWLPPWWRERLADQVPTKMRTFLGGQVMIAAGFSVVLSVIFSLLRVPLGLLFGFLIGMASMLPFMGAIAQTSGSLFLMLQDFGTGLQVFVIALLLGQIVDNVIVPRVMGNLVGVNPIWLIVAVFIGAKLAGFVGILLAVPVSSILKSLADDWMQENYAYHPPSTSPADSEVPTLDAAP
jgi:predicted PurR-regulated permease PerM